MGRTIGVPRLKAKMPKVKWTGIFGEGGETQQYGFEDEVGICCPPSDQS